MMFSFLAITLICFFEIRRVSISFFTSAIAAVFIAIYIVSALYFIWLLLAVSIIYFHVFILISIGLVTFLRIEKYKSVIHNLSVSVSFSSLIFFALLIGFMPKFSAHISMWGRWDAIAIWNLHAKFLFSENSWSDYLLSNMEWSHPDYPLFLPASIAYFWKAIGNISATVPFLISLFFTFSIPIVLHDSLPQKSLFQKLLAIFLPLLLCYNDTYLKWMLSQMADAPLALGILLALVYFNQFFRNKSTQALILASFIAFVILWIKNEALLFTLSFMAILIIHRYFSFQFRRGYFISTIFILLAFFLPLYFKLHFAPQNDLYVATSFEAFILKLFDATRYKVIGNYGLQTLIESQFWLLLFIPFLIIVFRSNLFTLIKLPTAQLLLLLTIFYFFIYVVTPKDLNWHLETSLIRLLVQIIPAWLFVLSGISLLQKDKQQVIS